MVAQLYDDILTMLGYSTAGLQLKADGPLTWVRTPGVEGGAPLVIARARPAADIEDLLEKDGPTLLEPYTPEGLPDSEQIRSVARMLSQVFVQADGPKLGLVLAGRWCLVVEAERWLEGRYLAVDLQLVCERNQTKRGGEIDRALTCLDVESLAPDAAGDQWWLSTLEDSVKHTVGVSKDLREGVRLSIEIIANEVVRRRAALDLAPLAPDQARPLAIQSLRYLYRILFLLYAEASPELGVLPVGASEYDQGYSLDRLRELTLVQLHGAKSLQGTHFTSHWTRCSGW